jgi:hypothetical protein
MRVIEMYRITDIKDKDRPLVHNLEIRPVQPIGFHIFIDGSPGFGGQLFAHKAADYKINEYKNNPLLIVDYLGARDDDTITPDRKQELKERADRLRQYNEQELLSDTQQTPSEGEIDMKKKAKTRAPRSAAGRAATALPRLTSVSVKDKLKIMGLGVTQFIHWMRDRKFSLTEARHVIEELGIEIREERAKVKPGEKAVRDNTIRPHLHCYPKFCKTKAPDMMPEFAKAVMDLKATTPKAKPPKVSAPKKKPAKQIKKKVAKKAKAKTAPKKKPIRNKGGQ